MSEELERLKKELEAERQRIIHEGQKLNSERQELDKYKAQLQSQKSKLQAEKEKHDRESTQPMVMLSGIGSLKEFEITDNWTAWTERFEHYVVVNSVPENKKKSLFITSLGPQAYELLRNLCTPESPSKKKLEELMTIMGNHLQPAPSVITERYKFKECRQTNDQDVKSYLAELKKLSMQCKFGENLESSIRDQFVWGLKSAAIKKRLLGEPNLTYSRAVEISSALESAANDVMRMESTSMKDDSSMINYVQDKKIKESIKCYCCGNDGHIKVHCKYKNYKCNICKVEGHLAQMCKSKDKKDNHKNAIKNNENKYKNYDKNKSFKRENQNFIEDLDIADDMEKLFHINDSKVVVSDSNKNNLIFVNLTVENKATKLELDTGSPVSAISKGTYDKCFKNKNMLTSNRKFKSYQGDVMKPLGFIMVNVEHKNRMHELKLYVFQGNNNPIVGRDWIQELELLGPIGSNSTLGLKFVGEEINSEKIMEEFEVVFTDELGKYNKRKIKLELKDGAKPTCCKPRPLPYALKDKVENEIKRLVNKGILMPVSDSEWATPIVPIVKKNGQIRICGDFKVTLNPWLKKNKHPIPRIQDLLSAVRKIERVSKLDLSDAYQQFELDDKSKELVVIATHLGLFGYNRLCFGVSPAPGIFQSELEKQFKGFEGVKIFYDDLFVYGTTAQEHDNRLKAVLNKLKECGLTLRKEKCEIGKKQVEFLGFVVGKNGISISDKKTIAISSITVPSNQSELRAFLGMVNYYSKFIRNYSSIVEPLYKLLRKDHAWSWSSTQQVAFDEVKACLCSQQVLMHYNPELPIKVTCDASPYGLGAVIAHVLSNKNCRPIAFASRSLTKAERGYSQIDKEAAAIVFAVKTFHQYLYGKHFVLETDHKPLIYIFGPNKGIPVMAASRLQRACKSSVESEFETIDNQEVQSPEYTYLNYVLDEAITINYETLIRESCEDRVLQLVIQYIKNGWPSKVDDEFTPYKNRARELSIENDCVMWGHRVVVPKTLQKQMLNELHSIHFGIVKMKAMARSFVWWPSIDSDIEEISKSCKFCLENADQPPRTQLHSWSWPDAPNHRLHLDFLGPIDSQMYLVIIDAFSKWVDIRAVRDITTKTTVLVLSDYFATWGLPHKIVSDNGPAFASADFAEFVKKYGIVHIKTAPYHPASNGAAENAVRSFKSKFKLMLKSGYDKSEALIKYLFYARATPHATTGVSPAELQIGRKFRTILDLIRPDVSEYVKNKQDAQRRSSTGNRVVNFEVGSQVMVKDYRTGSWLVATINSQLSPVTYLVDTGVHTWKRHADQIRVCSQNYVDRGTDQERVLNDVTRNYMDVTRLYQNRTPIDKNDNCNEARDEPIEVKDTSTHECREITLDRTSASKVKMETPIRRSQRTIRVPNRLNL
ncbi:uncharacterized protein K02A2.6-like isoform X2 [Cotesia glomerata]|uniref:uncharacterized protein K02A2.6-like isoform X2 n=1 Tax=Cotesia glomerata TaxID=32391 RepID=UPI001D0102A8|nr:uncharacterized protein K02A2.6-like isoform X2 [Cotesia glomerata]